MADYPKPFVASDFGTDAVIQHWRRGRQQQFAAAPGSASGRSEVIAVSERIEAKLTGQGPTVVIPLPEILLGAVLVEKGDKHPDGDIIVAVTPVFRRFLKELERDPNSLYQLEPRQLEELISRSL
jgi:hypothetical protein